MHHEVAPVAQNDWVRRVAVRALAHTAQDPIIIVITVITITITVNVFLFGLLWLVGRCGEKLDLAGGFVGFEIWVVLDVEVEGRNGVVGREVGLKGAYPFLGG